MKRVVKNIVLAAVASCTLAGGAVPFVVAADVADAPATQPVYVAQPAPPTTAPDVAPPAGPSARATPTSILLIPFVPIAEAAQMDWVGRGIQQDLGTDVARGSRLIVVTPANTTPATDSDSALRAAREVRAGLVVFGHYQVVGSNLRVTGQLLDVKTGEALTTLKATESKQNLFQIEDLLAQQIMAALPQELLTKASPTNTAPSYVSTPRPEYVPPSDSQQPASPQPSAQASTYSTPSQPYAYQSNDGYPNDSGYNYGPYYNDYGSYYGYPYGGTGFYLYGGYSYYHHGWYHRGDGREHPGGDHRGGYVGNGGAQRFEGNGARPSVGGGVRSGGNTQVEGAANGGGTHPGGAAGVHAGGGGGGGVGGGAGAHAGGGGGGGGHGGGGHR